MAVVDLPCPMCDRTEADHSDERAMLCDIAFSRLPIVQKQAVYASQRIKSYFERARAERKQEAENADRTRSEARQRV